VVVRNLTGSKDRRIHLLSANEFLVGGSDGYEATMKETNRDEPRRSAGAFDNSMSSLVPVGSSWFLWPPAFPS
jgi:hypothetical protein